MKLFLSALLVTLALYCYEANALTCPALATEMTSFLFQPAIIYEKVLLKYNPPPEVIEAKMKVKACTDKIPWASRVLISTVLGEILNKCLI